MRSGNIVTLVCLMLAIMLSISIRIHIRETPSIDNHTPTQESNVANQDLAESICKTETTSTILPIYPGSWKNMNAVIVKWGEQNGQSWSETYGQYSHYDRKSFKVKYIGINVEFITVYSETMKESLISDIENVIAQTTYLMIPQHHLDEITAGNTALVFLDKLANIITQEPNGNTNVTTLLGASVGECIAPDTYIPAPIFHIAEDKVIVSEACYQVRPTSGEYYMPVMNAMQEANVYIQKYSPDKTLAFESGLSVENLRCLFSFICKEH